MPAYHIDLTTERGTQRVPFTLDDERPLGPQLMHVLEELRQRGAVIAGGPDDELVVHWNGHEVDTERSPRAAGVSPVYPIELRMMRRDYVAARREPPPTPFLAKGVYVAIVAAITGALFAWIGTSMITDLGDLFPTYDALDLLAAAALGAGIGAGVLGASTLMRGRSAILGLLCGLLLGAVGGSLGTILALTIVRSAGWGDSRQSFILARVIAWVAFGGSAGAVTGMRWIGRDPRRILDGIGYGVFGGVFAGVVMSLPGPTDLWQLLAFVLMGAALGFGLTGPASRRGVGVFALDTVDDRSVGLLSHREWGIPVSGAIQIGHQLGLDARDGTCSVMAASVADGEAILLAGRPITRPSPIVNEDVVTLGAATYRFRRYPDDSR